MKTYHGDLLGGAAIVAVVAGLAVAIGGAAPARADASDPLDKRKALYAPWSPDQMAARRKEMGLIGPGPTKPFPQPAFPSYLRAPNNIEALMPNARAAAAQTAGRVPLGLVKRGQTALIVVGEVRDAKPVPLVQQAIRRAVEERGVKLVIMNAAELIGVSEADVDAIRKARQVHTFRDGQQELEYFYGVTGQMPDPRKGKAWVKEKDPALHDATWPALKIDDPKIAELERSFERRVTAALIKYLDEHKEIDWVFWRSGGRSQTRARLKHHGDRYMGNYTYLDYYDLMSQVPSYPSDVWRLVESKMIEPLNFVDRVEVTDPEGTAFGFDVSPEMAAKWAKGVYQQGHLFMFPSQSTGRYPYAVVEYPALAPQYQMPEQPEVNGVFASTNSHAASHPRIEIHVKQGRIDKILGGGLYGEGWRLLLTYPGTQDLTWPHFKKPGYWWLFEAGTATNPKYYKHPAEIARGRNLSERNAAGVIHWAFGTEALHGPEKVGEMSPATIEFAKKHNLPPGHSMHNHNLMPTYQVRIRDLDQWVTLIEHGRISALDDIYVRALASRYGNPDEVLRQDYVTAMPGVTVPGNYDDYAKDPGTYWINWAKSIDDGTYKHFKP